MFIINVDRKAKQGKIQDFSLPHLLPPQTPSNREPSSLLGRCIYIWSAKGQFHPAGPTLQDTEVTASGWGGGKVPGSNSFRNF